MIDIISIHKKYISRRRQYQILLRIVGTHFGMKFSCDAIPGLQCMLPLGKSVLWSKRMRHSPLAIQIALQEIADHLSTSKTMPLRLALNRQCIDWDVGQRIHGYDPTLRIWKAICSRAPE